MLNYTQKHNNRKGKQRSHMMITVHFKEFHDTKTLIWEWKAHLKLGYFFLCCFFELYWLKMKQQIVYRRYKGGHQPSPTSVTFLGWCFHFAINYFCWLCCCHVYFSFSPDWSQHTCNQSNQCQHLWPRPSGFCFQPFSLSFPVTYSVLLFLCTHWFVPRKSSVFSLVF